MTQRPTQPLCSLALLRRLRAVAVIACICKIFCNIPLQAAESISAYVDASGRVVFVNEGSDTESGLKSAADSPASTRRVINSTAPAPKEQSASSPFLNNDAVGEAAESDSASAKLSNDLDTIIQEAANAHSVDPDLVRAIVRVESNFNPYAVSPAGARGLMQLIPATAQRFGVANAFDPRANLDGGIRYLKYLLGMYGGDLRLSLAAYNAGEDAVARSGGVPSYRETQSYIRKISEIYPLRVVATGLPPEPQIVKSVDATGVVHFSNTDQR